MQRSEKNRLHNVTKMTDICRVTML